jgi:GNAT superfamily N-acetyltransferase
MTIAPGTGHDLPRFAELLEELGAWLWERGIHQWAAGSSRAQLPLLSRYVDSGALLLARDADRLAGGCIVTSVASPEWSERPGPAAYVHKVAVARHAAGRGLGARLLGAAADWAREREWPRLRLDCWDGNAVLRRYYRDRGFAELDAVPSHGYIVRLFERTLAGEAPC